MNHLLAISGVVAYGLTIFLLFKNKQRTPALLCAALAITLHALTVYQSGLSLRFFQCLSLVGLLVALVSTLGLLRSPLRFLATLAYAVAAITVAIEAFAPPETPRANGWQIHLHAAIALLAYAVLSLAGMQALLVLVAERALQMRRWPALMSALPALSRLERQLFELIAVGFGLLTLTLLSGALFISDWSAQHLVHKTVLTVSAWMVFATLLLGHWRYGWRGKQAAYGTLAGMGLLLLGFFGSQIVLQIILKRT